MSADVQQNDTRFEPTPKMIKLLDAAVNPEVEPSISAWCQAADVGRWQWYRWREDPAFVEWFSREFNKAVEGSRASLVKIGLQKALLGDFQFWKVMMEKVGEYNQTVKFEGDPIRIFLPEVKKNE